MRAAGIAVRTLQWSFKDAWSGDGRRLCVWCSTPLPAGKKKQRWCSKKCVDEFLVVKGDMGLVRSKLRAREKECCQGCGSDLKALAQILRVDLEVLGGKPSCKAFLQIWGRWRDWMGLKPQIEMDQQAFRFIVGPDPLAPVVKLRMVLQVFSRRSLWQADHILAVEAGGSGTDLSNFQLLCTKCHLGKTNMAKAMKATTRREQTPRRLKIPAGQYLPPP
jgi:hypothetical protein